eukprot:CAMPEP_0172455490 /NCGR_PEP_ID=MMETSP1065-20121228/12094_1 /TAXON_ID=265537 /ORGANISM="Amphiprora paludosa, Strain CCMP125" /LENGTH=178 /DNA_ID=CAMNT_0013207951 /DNA_START=106 /DNA_END=642 /DNA_ORIENTATION=+
MTTSLIQLVTTVLLLFHITACLSQQTRGANSLKDVVERHLPASNRQCQANEACSHLHGNCCPTNDGTLLDCCDAAPRTCEQAPACAALGLKGSCCPTLAGADLDCCSTTAEPTKPPTVPPSTLPSVFPSSVIPPADACIAPPIEASGCCPTLDIVYLDEVQDCGVWLVLCGQDNCLAR